MKKQFDICEKVTNQIIDLIEAGEATYKMPWFQKSGVATNALTQNRYNGINQFLLMFNEYQSPNWATFKQWAELGAKVKKGEKGSIIVFAKKVSTKQTNPETGEKEENIYFCYKPSWVFNAEQVEGWEEEKAPMPKLEGADKINALEDFLQSTQANIIHKGDAAFYRPSTDEIYMPSMDKFFSTETRSATEGYYAIALHELTHWTGAADRLNRLKGSRYGSKSYAFEELVAEIGSAFLCSHFNLSPEVRPDHAGYVKSWLAVLKNDKKAIFKAAKEAQQAMDFLLNLQSKCATAKAS